MSTTPIRRALIAVYDKTGIVDFARALVDEFGIEIISTGGTAKHLKDAGIPVTMVEAVTGFPEMLDGRVKTLHPHIHAGILADRDNPEHMRQLAEHNIQPIDMVVVNLYPFEKTIADPNCKFEDAIEMIDIGGPCLLRAAAKNHKHVLALLGREYGYEKCLKFLRGTLENDDRDFRAHESALIFLGIRGYDTKVSDYLFLAADPSLRDFKFDLLPSPHFAISVLHEIATYGENPHQSGASYQQDGKDWKLKPPSEVEDRPRMSFNNYVDADAALGLCAELTRAGNKLWHRLLVGVRRKAAKAQLPAISQQLNTRRNLPHIQRPGATYFLTFRVTSGTLTPDERGIVMECCLFPDKTKYCLHAAVVMPDHVHLLISPLESERGNFYQLGEITRGIKGASARRINELVKHEGSVWMDETWDRIIRDEAEFFQKLEYIVGNPRTAGLEQDEPYPWCVHEAKPGWIKDERSAGIDLQHALVFPSVGHRAVGSAGAKKDEHRLIVGATSQAPLQIHAVVFIKHTNACGVGIGDDASDAYRTAYLGDPNAAMGGVLAVNFPVTADFAQVVMETYDRFGKAAGTGGFFVEVWVAPSFDDNAVAIIRGNAESTAEIPNPPKKKWGENVRLLAIGDISEEPDPKALEYKTIAGGMLVQTPDLIGLNEDQWKVVTKRAPTESEMSDLRLAWLIAKHTKSNAISICKDGMLIGNGAGQMSRVMSCRIATWLAKENGHADKLAGAVAASDAFFPFRDGPGILMDAGITAIIQPGGSKRDEETIAACDERGVAMIFTGTRHFRH